MARWGKADFKELKVLDDRLARLSEVDFDAFCRKLAKNIAARLLSRVKKRTPVGVAPEGLDADTQAQYWSGYTGGTLQDAWTILPVEKIGNEYVVTVINPIKYASYVEYGHRQRRGRYVPALGKRLTATWVKGQFIMTIAAQEVENMLPGLVEQKLYSLLKDVF